MCSGGRAQRRAEREYREKVGGAKRIAQAEQEMISRQQTGRKQRRLLSPFEASLRQARKDKNTTFLSARIPRSIAERASDERNTKAALGITEEQWQAMSKQEKDNQIGIWWRGVSRTQDYKESATAYYGPGGTL